MTVFTLSIHQSASSSPSAEVDHDRIVTDEIVSLPADQFLPRISTAIPPLSDPEQAYFWTSDWQAAERTADEELRRGEAPTFATVEDGMRWLLSNE